MTNPGIGSSPRRREDHRLVNDRGIGFVFQNYALFRCFRI
jgi:ABC-type sulfate/molybdate transport systems ATPase subunit